MPLRDHDHVFQKGHRIMVQVQSSWFPMIDRNPQTFVPNIAQGPARSDYREGDAEGVRGIEGDFAGDAVNRRPGAGWGRYIMTRASCPARGGPGLRRGDDVVTAVTGVNPVTSDAALPHRPAYRVASRTPRSPAGRLAQFFSRQPVLKIHAITPRHSSRNTADRRPG